MTKYSKDFNLGIMTPEEATALAEKIQGKTWRNILVTNGAAPGPAREVIVTVDYNEGEDLLEVAEFLMHVIATS